MPATPKLLPAQPTYIFRGHASQIHAVHFYAANTRLLTADADGWTVVWSLTTKRAVAVWKAHEGAVLNVGEWGGKIITHGRDNKLFLWRLDKSEEPGMDALLPVEDCGRSPGSRRKPWLVASLDVNALNFCGFAACVERGGGGGERLLVAVPSAVNSDDVDVRRLPGGERVYAGVGTAQVKTGMAMALSMLYRGDALVLVGGYESGHAVVYRWDTGGPWSVVYVYKPHSQPVLSLAVSPFPETAPWFITSSADAIIAKHPLPSDPSAGGEGEEAVAPLKIVDTRHSGQQSVVVRSDGRIFATAGWDSRIRVYSARTMKELAVLKWHREGCYAVGFGEVLDAGGGGGGGGEERGGGGEEEVGIVSIEERRNERVRMGHWVAGGAKDGKVSLWEIY